MKISQKLYDSIALGIKNYKKSDKHEIELIDVTLRDGGFKIGFNWGENFIKEFVSTSCNTGIRNIEVGYIGGVKNTTGWYEGISSDLDPDFIYALKESNPSLFPVIIINPSRVKRSINLVDYNKCGIGLLRVVYNNAHLDQINKFIIDAHNYQIPICLNITNISKLTENDLTQIINYAEKIGVKQISLADTLSNFTLEDLDKIRPAIQKAKGKSIKIGFHGHNTLGLGNTNAHKMIDLGINYLDVSLSSIGRGGSNLSSEHWMTYLALNSEIKSYNIDKFPKLSLLLSNKIEFKPFSFLPVISSMLGVSPELIEEYESLHVDELIKLNIEICKTVSNIINYDKRI